ncbi:MAG: type II secretion system protein GspM [Deltaproteobacteria bacterium]|nr:type II secretion system protein GspM [Deltaproteobacteria bacterium]
MTPAVRFQAKMRALSHRERILLLLGAVSVLLFVLVRFGAYPAIDSYRKSRAALPKRFETLARYRLAAQGEEKIDESFADAAGQLEEAEEGILPGNNPAAAGAALQGILKPMVERPDTRLTSVRALAPVQRGAYAETSVQMDLQTTTEGLAGMLAEVARNPKILRVKKLSVSSGYFGMAAANRRETLVVSVVVAGITGAEVDTKGERAEQ